MSRVRLSQGPPARDIAMDEYLVAGYYSDASLRSRLLAAINPAGVERKALKSKMLTTLGRTTRPTLYRLLPDKRRLEIVYVVNPWHPVDPGTMERWQELMVLVKAWNWTVSVIERRMT